MSGALVLAGCAGGQASVPDGVTVELRQLRSDVADRTAQVRVVNGSDADLAITGLRVTDAWFAGDVVRGKDSTVPAGRTVDLRIELPASACEGEPDAADRETTLTLTLLDGSTVAADLPDPLGFTTQLHERECRAHDAAAIAELEWDAFTPQAAPAPASLRLVATPQGGDGELRIVSVQPTNLLQFAAGTPTPFAVDLAVGGAVTGTEASAVTVEVPLIPLRCDPHAVMEDKRGTVFTVHVGLDGEEGPIEVAAPAAMTGEILTWVARWCGFG